MSIAHVLPEEPQSLRDYIFTGNTEQVRKILTENLKKPTFDINAHEPDGHTPLELACIGAHIDIIKALVDHKADVNTNHKKKSPLFFAILAKMNAPQAVEYLLSQKADPNHQVESGWPPLCLAAVKGCIHIIHSLLQHKADPKKTISEGRSPVWLAAANGHTEAVRTLAAAKADLNKVNSENESPLWRAVIGGHKNTVEELLTLKADPNFKPTLSHHANYKPILPHYENIGRCEMFISHIEVMKILAAAKADIFYGFGLNYWHIKVACRNNNSDSIKFLIAAGADLVPPHDELYSNEINKVLREARENPVVVRTKLLLEEVENFNIMPKGKFLLRYCLFLHNRLSEIEILLEEQKNNVSEENAVELQKLIDCVKNMKLQLSPPSLRLQTMAYVITHGESTSTPEEPASPPLSSSTFTLLASPAEARAQSVEAAAQLSNSITPEKTPKVEVKAEVNPTNRKKAWIHKPKREKAGFHTTNREKESPLFFCINANSSAEAAAHQRKQQPHHQTQQDHKKNSKKRKYIMSQGYALALRCK